MAYPPHEIATKAIAAVTDEMLEELRAEAVERGDTVMVLRCVYALVDDLARLDVAVILSKGGR
jgi:hypothetical protein